jgi:hypothetical protein
MTKKTTPKKLDPVKRVKTSVKFEKITLITATETYEDDGSSVTSYCALDEIIPMIEKYGDLVTLISYSNGTDLELIERREETNE